MKVLLVGDIVGAPGRDAFIRTVERLKSEHLADIVIANAENSAGGRGMTAAIGEELLEAGADAITLGDHVWDQKDIKAFLEREPRVVRPLNMPPGCPGRGFSVINTPFGPVSVVSLIGRVFMSPNDCPFRAMDDFIGRGAFQGPVFVDIHAEATSEKIVLGRYLDGRVTCVFGTHTHVQTSDETVLPGGTAYITDLGMTGSKDSAIGRDLASITSRFLTGIPDQFKVATKDVALEGAVVNLDRGQTRARSIERIRIMLQE